MLHRLEHRCQFVFPSFIGRLLSRLYLSRRFEDFVREVGLPEYVNFHTTRHTCASWLPSEG